MILNSTVLKLKAALDQFRKGLNILGLLSKIENNPEKFEQLFVHHDGDIAEDFVKKLLNVPDTSSDPVVQDAVNMLHEFIDT